jgi:hypothetical protein
MKMITKLAKKIRSVTSRIVIRQRLLKIIAFVAAHLLSRYVAAHMPDWSPQLVSDVVAFVGSELVGVLALVLAYAGFKLKQEDDEMFEYLKQNVKVEAKKQVKRDE